MIALTDSRKLKLVNAADLEFRVTRRLLAAADESWMSRTEDGEVLQTERLCPVLVRTDSEGVAVLLLHRDHLDDRV